MFFLNFDGILVTAIDKENHWRKRRSLKAIKGMNIKK